MYFRHEKSVFCYLFLLMYLIIYKYNLLLNLLAIWVNLAEVRIRYTSMLLQNAYIPKET